MFNVIRIWSVVRQPICQNQSPDRPVDLWSIFGRQTGSAGRHLRKFQMTKRRPTDDRHNKLSADGQTMIDVGRRTIQRLFQFKKIGHSCRKNELGQTHFCLKNSRSLIFGNVTEVYRMTSHNGKLRLLQ